MTSTNPPQGPTRGTMFSRFSQANAPGPATPIAGDDQAAPTGAPGFPSRAARRAARRRGAGVDLPNPDAAPTIAAGNYHSPTGGGVPMTMPLSHVQVQPTLNGYVTLGAQDLAPIFTADGAAIAATMPGYWDQVTAAGNPREGAQRPTAMRARHLGPAGRRRG